MSTSRDAMTSSIAPLARDKSDTLLLLATCVMVLAPHALRLPLWTSLLCLILLGWRAWISFTGQRMPRRWILLLVSVAAVSAAYLSHKTLFGREAGVMLLVLLITLKLLEMHARRDLFTVIFASLFLVLANFFYSQSIPMAGWMAFTVVALLTTQLSFQYTGLVPSLRKRLAFGGAIAGLSIPLTLVLFLLFPRIQGPLWSMPTDAASGRMGLSDSMAPGNISQLASSTELAFRVRFIDPPPARDKLYWRAVVLGDFDGRRWTRSQQLGNTLPVKTRWRGLPIRHEVTLEASGRPWLFALELPQAVPTIRQIGTGITSDMQLLAERPLNERVRYEVSSYVDFELQNDDSVRQQQAWRNLPDGFNPRSVEFARQLRAQSQSPDDMIAKVLRHFRRESFRYTLNPPLLGEHTVDEFLFVTRAGFCEHYASAFVVLMRAAGIPARVVTGYQGGEMNPVDGLLSIRQSDAHAWAEVWLAGSGWRRIDPTAAVAPERVEASLASAQPATAFGGFITISLASNSVFGTLRYNWEAMNNQWNQVVLNYSADKQRDLLKSFGFNQADWGTLTLLMVALGSLAMAAVVFPLLWQGQRRDPLLALYHKLDQKLGARGLSRAIHEGPRAYRERILESQLPLTEQQRHAAHDFLAHYEALRYAPMPKSTESERRTTQAAALQQLNALLKLI